MIAKNISWITIVLLAISLVSASTFGNGNIEIRQGNIKITEKLEYPNCYSVNLTYKFNKINIESIEIVPCKIVADQGAYSIRVIDNEKEIINSNNFIIPNIEFYEYFDLQSGKIIGGETRLLEDVSFNIFVPYSERGKEIIIYDEEKEIARKSIQKESFFEKLKKYLPVLIIILLLVPIFYFLKKRETLKK